jgi:hypothetical protein
MMDVVRRTAEACFMPLTVGGGVRTVDDIKMLLGAGTDKVSINSAAVSRREFVKEAAEKFGDQCIVVAIDAKRVKRGGGGERWELKESYWADAVMVPGVNECLTSIDTVLLDEDELPSSIAIGILHALDDIFAANGLPRKPHRSDISSITNQRLCLTKHTVLASSHHRATCTTEVGSVCVQRSDLRKPLNPTRRVQHL